MFKAITSIEDSACLAPLVEHVKTIGTEESSWLHWLLRISEVQKVVDDEDRVKAAAELYELMNDALLPAGFDHQVCAHSCH